MEEFQVWEGCSVGSCGVGEFRYVVIAVWEVAMWGICSVGGCFVWELQELQFGGVRVWESCGVCELLCVAVVVYSNCGLWGF